MSDQIIDKYFEVKKMVHKYFNYNPDWVEIPLEDYRDYKWKLEQELDGSGNVFFWDLNNILYSHEIYTQRFLNQWVYETEKHTLICVDTKTDGNKFLAIFDNNKHCDIIPPD